MNHDYHVKNEDLFFCNNSTLFNDLALENIEAKGQ